MSVHGWFSTRRAFAGGFLIGLILGLSFLLFRAKKQGDLVIKVEPITTPSTVVVYVTGAVERPGLYTLPSGSRVAHAVERAGPFADADLARLAMAEQIRDGQTILVPQRRHEGAAVPSLSNQEPEEATKRNFPLNINTATAEQLQQLPGIGPALAQRIIAYREQHGPFRSVEQLIEVQGISSRMVAEWEGLITVGSVE